ncbi:DUF2271 domain-containing protein [Aquimarina sp. U1-2]|uniref:DUF2271 domain-containing protein n=1 Tax=Aquimarina sp. U1-2 TaxID=2823141 RepID=UPI001AECCF52|nr:DUF2271 domain-containing protein [Aquimarina sp. U1-2]MBP2832391.1 DUF2271 domain-containing protein [Aquimarina sp. U1-2]
MRTLLKIGLISSIFTLVAFAFKPLPEKTAVKCMIQLINYTGEGAYVVISLINPEGNYEETLYVQGKDPEWYSEITEWWKFYGKRRSAIDAISGETVPGGERTVSIINIPTDKIDQGYQLRFETAVEDQEYYETDAQIALTTENLNTKLEGKGWIRYIRMMPK